MAKSNVVPVTTKKTELATASDISGFEAFANQGLESVSAQDLAIPYLRILAQLSPQVNKRDGAYVQGAEAGMIYNTVENVAYDGEEGIRVVPCYYRRVLVEWKPREQGGGYVATYHNEDPIGKKTFKDSKGKDILPNGNILETTTEFYVLMLDDEGSVKRCLITMTSTQLKKGRTWVTQLQTTFGKSKNGGMFVMPIMSHIYRLSTVEERNDKGSWFGWLISRERIFDLKDENDVAIYNMAIEFSKSIGAGNIKVRQENEENDVSGVSGQIIDSEEIPF